MAGPRRALTLRSKGQGQGHAACVGMQVDMTAQVSSLDHYDATVIDRWLV